MIRAREVVKFFALMAWLLALILVVNIATGGVK